MAVKYHAEIFFRKTAPAVPADGGLHPGKPLQETPVRQLSRKASPCWKVSITLPRGSA